MPEQPYRKLETRTQFRDQDTFRYTTPDMKVVAQPIDTYVQPQKPSKRVPLAELYEALGVTSAIAQEEYSKWAQYQKSLAGDDILQGLDAPNSTNRTRIREFERLKGEADASDYYAELAQYTKDNGQRLPGEFDGGLKELKAKYLGGRSKNYAMGFMKRAMQVDEQAKVHNRLSVQKAVSEEYRQNLGKVILQDLEGAQPLLSSPELGKVMRGHLSKLQQRAADFGMTKSEVTEYYLRHALAKADQDGNPNLLAFATVPDESGYQVAGDPKLKQLVVNGLQAAQASKERLEAATLQDAKANEKKLKDQQANQFISELFSIQPGDTDFRGKVNGIISRLEASRDAMDTPDYRMIRQMAYEVQQSGGFRKSPDFEKYHEAMDLAQRGELTNLTPYMPFLDVGSYNQLRSVQDRANDDMKNRAYSYSVDTMESMLKEGIALVAGEPDFTGKLPEGYRERSAAFNLRYRTLMEAERIKAQQAGSIIPVERVHQIQQQAIKDTWELHGKPGEVRTQRPATKVPAPLQGASAEQPIQDIASELDKLDKMLTKPKKDLGVVAP